MILILIQTIVGNELFVACHKGNVELAKKLLIEGAKANSISWQSKQTPLHIAVKTNNRMLVELLLQYGADINAKDSMDFSPKDLASKISGQFCLDPKILTLMEGKGEFLDQ